MEMNDRVPKKERYSISVYEIANTKNIGIDKTEKSSYDLMTMVIVRLGEPEYRGNDGDEGYDLLRFLNVLMYPHKEDFMDVMKEYIDFSDNEELWKEVTDMGGLGQSILEEGLEYGIEEGREQGKLEMVLELIQEKILTVKEGAKRLNIEEKELEAHMR